MTPRRYDIVAVADPRFPGGTSSALCRELDALAADGLSVALLPIAAGIFPAGQPRHPDLAGRIDSGTLPVIAAGDAVECGLLVAHNPMLFEAPLPRHPLTAQARLLVVHQAPVTGDGRLLYDPVRVEAVLDAAFGGPWLWAPTGLAGRVNLSGCGCALRIAAADWPLVVDAAAWGAPRRGCRGPIPVAGRHSRADRLKWPADPGDLRLCFPDRPDLRVRLLGFGGRIAEEIGTPPVNWEILPFAAEPAASFLRSIDFFVYHHHDEWFETFGLTVAEAMASGAVAILSPRLRTTFGEAALYAKPAGVYPLLRALADDPAAYARQSAAGWNWVHHTLAPARLAATAHRLLAADGDIAFTAVAGTAAGASRRRRLDRRRRLQAGAALLRRLPGGETLVRTLRRLSARPWRAAGPSGSGGGTA